MWHQRLLLGLTQALFNGFLNPRQTGAVLVFGQLADATHTAVAQVVDVIDFTAAIAQVNQDFDYRQDVFIAQNHIAFSTFAADFGVELHAANARQIIGIHVVEQAEEQCLHRVIRWWLARTHHAVDGNARTHFVLGFVNTQRLADVRALIQLVGVETLDVADVRIAQFLQQRFSQLFVRFSDDFTRIRIDHIFRQCAAQQEVFRHADVRCFRLLEFTRVARGYALVFGNQDIAALVDDVEARNLTTQVIGYKSHLRARVHQLEVVENKEVFEDGFRRHADGFEQNSYRHFAATIYTEVEQIFRVKLEIEP